MFAKLKKIISDCHFDKSVVSERLLAEASKEYAFDRAIEALRLAKDGNDPLANLQLAIRCAAVAILRITNGQVSR
jgi:hypothetical protein